MKINIAGNKINYKAIHKATGEINWLVTEINGEKICLFPDKKRGGFMKITQLPEEYDADMTELVEIK